MQDTKVDAQNQDHIQAYLLARLQCARPRAETVLAILESAKQTLTSGARLQSDFVLVPKSNILGSAVLAPESAASAPEWLQEWLITEEELRSTFKVPPKFLIYDASAPIARLGKG